MVLERNMLELENATQKNLVNFCKTLQNFVDKYKTVLEMAKNPTKAIVNFSEQIRLIKSADMRSCIDNFVDMQTNLQSKILLDIEEEISTLKRFIYDLNLLNQDLKNKLSNLEKSTIELNWESDTILLRGNAIQPPLSKVLQMGYDFYVFFANILTGIKDSLNALNAYDENSINSLDGSVNVDIDKRNSEENCNIYYLIAITQYAGNEKAIT